MKNETTKYKTMKHASEIKCPYCGAVADEDTGTINEIGTKYWRSQRFSSDDNIGTISVIDTINPFVCGGRYIVTKYECKRGDKRTHRFYRYTHSHTVKGEYSKEGFKFKLLDKYGNYFTEGVTLMKQDIELKRQQKIQDKRQDIIAETKDLLQILWVFLMGMVLLFAYTIVGLVYLYEIYPGLVSIIQSIVVVPTFALSIIVLFAFVLRWLGVMKDPKQSEIITQKMQDTGGLSLVSHIFPLLFIGVSCGFAYGIVLLPTVTPYHTFLTDTTAIFAQLFVFACVIRIFVKINFLKLVGILLVLAILIVVSQMPFLGRYLL